MLEDTRSSSLISLLREGYRRDREHQHDGTTTPSSHNSGSSHSRRLSLNRRGSKAAPSLSELNTLEETPALYEIFFPAPPNSGKLEILRYHVTTRNVFALLMNKPIVGLTFYQGLVDLHERLMSYLPAETDCAGLIIKYLLVNGLNDVRNDPVAAAGLVAWSEDVEVRWQEGWLEGFVHCFGMYGLLTILPEFRDVSLVTRALLERAHLELQIRIQDAEDRLATFNFDSIWPAQSAQAPYARVAFDRFRRFLKQFYETIYKSWPPRGQASGDSWLSREIVVRLQTDFGSLYDYCVDHDVTWDDHNSRMLSKSGRADFRAEGDTVRMADLFNGFDRRFKHPHIPHPWPLLPASVPLQPNTKSGLFRSKKNKGLDNRVAHAYSEASNVFHLPQEFAGNDLVEAFLKFEKTDQPGDIDPPDARKGRWILLYCILQVLSTISVDTPNLWAKDGVLYFLNPRLKGTPPWRTQTETVFQESSRSLSHCWKVPETWATAQDRTQPPPAPRNHRHAVVPDEGVGDSWPLERFPSSEARSAYAGAIGRSYTRSPPPQIEGRIGLEDRFKQQMRLRRDVGRSDFVPPDGW